MNAIPHVPIHEDAKAATVEARGLSDEAIRARVIQLGFGGDAARFDTFVAALREALPPDVTVLVRGSAVVGRRWADGQPFDADGPGTSDLDLTLVGGGMLKLWQDDAIYIPALHSAPLDDKTPDAAPVLVPLRRALCAIAGRPVNLQATNSLVQFARDVLMDQPTHTLVDAGARQQEEREAEREAEREREAEQAHEAREPAADAREG